MTGWQFFDSDNHVYEFPSKYIFWPDGYLVLCRDRIKFKAVHAPVKNVLGNFEFGLIADGELLQILDADEHVMDRVHYGSMAPWPQDEGIGYTIELSDLSKDNALGENWQAVTLFGTPGQ